MCYRCNICHNVVPERMPMKKHVITRKVPYEVVAPRRKITQYADEGSTHVSLREEVAAEIPVCASCDAALKDGVALRDLRLYNGVVMKLAHKTVVVKDGDTLMNDPEVLRMARDVYDGIEEPGKGRTKRNHRKPK
jgi:hypothetical protein